MAVEAGLTASSSPRNTVKFLCSFGGKILLRVGDGHVKYIHGETRVIAFPRGITFSEREEYRTGDGIIVLRRGKEDTISLKNLPPESFNNR
ncbi:hypothetical protein SADUNF_Sadunf03G0151200 [Salix dunnii]|uniref:Uncharacterized protein n=1 Tax=Salix dunnii TaxID=1413687 RepID=A0A835N4Z5_9ROSI|nr:hypothetical protein SADUNF_Sadunf03G0151200 [Salix dunnii]